MKNCGLIMNDEQINKLLNIMALLRDPDNGCDWDKKQTIDSIRQYTIEEAYEVAEAIDQNNMDDLRDELGDLLLQVVFYSQIAKEENIFNFSDVVNAIINKLISRHPHVFNKTNHSTDFSEVSWEELKVKERENKATTIGRKASVLDDIPKALPALMRAVKIQKRTANIGFDWNEIESVINKVHEELEELKYEMKNGMQPDRLLDESGDLLFSCVNLLRHLKVDPESALRSTNIKFEKRFRALENSLEEKNQVPSELTLEELELIWNNLKKSV